MEKVTDIIPQAVEKWNLTKKYKTRIVLFYWPEIVGEDIAAQSKPMSIEYGVLYLSVKNSVWCHHLNMMKEEMTLKINQFVGEIVVRDIRFKNFASYEQEYTQVDEKPGKSLEQQIKAVQLEREENQQASDLCAKVKEEALRCRLNRIYEKHLKLNKLKRLKKWRRCAACSALCPEDSAYCQVCSLEKKQARILAIRRALRDVPWASYGEIHRYIACSAQEYIDAKVTLMQQFASCIQGKNAREIDIKTLTMLFTGVHYEALNENLVKKTLERFRRGSYVSASRN